jgi:flagellar hook-associated protein 3 FlgL
VRISTGQIYRSALGAVLEQQLQLQRTQQQISTGKRISSPADDPAGAANLVGLKESMQVTRQYQENISAARTQLQQEEATLGSVRLVLDRVRELALGAANAALSESDRRAVAVEMAQRISDLEGLANAISPTGEYLFAGYQGLTRPFAVGPGGTTAYYGDEGQRFVQIGANRLVAVNDPGAGLFMDIARGNGRFAALAGPDNAGSGVIDPGSVTGGYNGGAYRIGFPVTTTAGPSLAFNDAGANDDPLYTLTINGTPVYQVAASGAPVATLEDLATEINLHAGVTGVRAVVDAGELMLMADDPAVGDIEVTETLGAVSDGAADTVTGYFGSALTGDEPSASIVYPAGAADRYLVEDALGVPVASGVFADGEQIAFAGVQTRITGEPRHGDVFHIEPAGRQNVFATIGDFIGVLESGASGATLGNAVNAFLTGIDQAMEKVSMARAGVGGRLNALDTQEQVNEDTLLRLDTARSGLEDLDYASAISDFSRQMMALQAAYSSFSQIQGLSLFNYLR